MADHKEVKVDAKAVKNAEATWSNFIAASKVSAYITCGILLLLWLVFIVL